MIATRYAKVIMTFGLALFGLIVAADNIIDYGTNFAFVQHVLSMDTTFPGSLLTWRAITAPPLHHLGYGLIIAAEAVTGVCFLVCSCQLTVNRNAPARRFHRAKSFGVIAATIGFANWFIGFMVVGGEWFAMWEPRSGTASRRRFISTPPCCSC